MEIRQLRYFVKIADVGSFSRAAQALFIAQPALSQQVAQLEAELGHPLLHRRHNGVQVTEQGAAFYVQAQRILKDIDDVPNVVNRSAEDLRGTISLGLPQSTGFSLALPLIQRVGLRHPGVHLEISDEISGNLLPALESGRLDLAVLVHEKDAEQAESLALADEELFLVVPMASELKGPVSIEQLVHVQLALPSIHHGVRALVEDAVRARGCTLPRPAVVANSLTICRRAVVSGLACSVLPAAAVTEEIAQGTVRALPLLPSLWRRSHVCHARGHGLSLAARAVRDLLFETASELVASGRWDGARLLRETSPV